jgi:hypothetical protein
MIYHPQESSAHGKAEEEQWVRLLSSGDPVKGMLLVTLQKMCTAFHEFEPAYQAGALKDGQLPFFRERLSKRVERVLNMIKRNSIETLAGVHELEDLKLTLDAEKTMAAIAELTEKAHAISHTICDSLERMP